MGILCLVHHFGDTKVKIIKVTSFLIIFAETETETETETGTETGTETETEMPQ
jgi:hypothetical protein